MYPVTSVETAGGSHARVAWAAYDIELDRKKHKTNGRKRMPENSDVIKQSPILDWHIPCGPIRKDPESASFAHRTARP